MDKLKLLLRKAIFAGKTFSGHCNNISEIIDLTDDQELTEFFEIDNDAMQLLIEWEELREELGIEL